MLWKKKASEIRRAQQGTGGGPELEKILTDLELKILAILGTTFYEGVGVTEHGAVSLSMYTAIYISSCTKNLPILTYEAFNFRVLPAHPIEHKLM